MILKKRYGDAATSTGAIVPALGSSGFSFWKIIAAGVLSGVIVFFVTKKLEGR